MLYVSDGVYERRSGQPPGRIARSQSRLGEAIRKAQKMAISAERPELGPLLLISDGHDTGGDALIAARALAHAGGFLFVRPPDHSLADVSLDSLRVITDGERPEFEVSIESTTRGTAQVELLRDTQVVSSKDVALTQGRSVLLRLSDERGESSGSHRRYRVRLVPSIDTPNEITKNDELVTVLTRGKRRGVFWGDPAIDEPTWNPSSDLSLRMVDTLKSEDLHGADIVVISNVPYHEVRSIEIPLEQYVARGGSLLMLGGPESYGGGSWSGTRLETSLAALKSPTSESIGLAMVLALDHSGSMAGGALARMRDAAQVALSGMSPNERVAILPFAAGIDERLLPPGFVRSSDTKGVAKLNLAMDELEARGATRLLPALQQAAKLLRDIDAREKRVVVLSDGDPDHRFNERELEATRALLVEERVSFGALLVGMDHAVARLKTLASNPDDVQLLRGAGEFPERLRQQLSRRRARKERLDAPLALRVVNQTLLPIESDLRMTYAHRLVMHESAERLADVAVTSPRSRHPWAAMRRVGAGTVVSLAWGPECERAMDQGRSLKKLDALVARLANASDRGLAAEIRGNALYLSAPFAARRGALDVYAATEYPKRVTTLTEIRPGEFQGPLPVVSDLMVRRDADWQTLRLPVRPALEYRRIGVDLSKLDALARAGGGRLLRKGQAPPSTPSKRGPSWAPWFLLIALALFVLERHHSNTKLHESLRESSSG